MEVGLCPVPWPALIREPTPHSMPILSVNIAAHSTEKLSGGTAHRTRQPFETELQNFLKGPEQTPLQTLQNVNSSPLPHRLNAGHAGGGVGTTSQGALGAGGAGGHYCIYGTLHQLFHLCCSVQLLLLLQGTTKEVQLNSKAFTFVLCLVALTYTYNLLPSNIF